MSEREREKGTKKTIHFQSSWPHAPAAQIASECSSLRSIGSAASGDAPHMYMYGILYNKNKVFSDPLNFRTGSRARAESFAGVRSHARALANKL